MPCRLTTAESCYEQPSLGRAGLASLRSALPDPEAIGAVVNFLSMTANPIRLQLLLALRIREELCVCDLAGLVGMSPAAVSAHLQKLKLAGVVRSHRDGQMVRYCLVKRDEMERLESLFERQESV